MGKFRDIFKKIRDIKGTFHAEMGKIKDRNDMNLTEAEDTKKGWQEYSESESEVAQSCPTLWDPMNCSLPGSSVYGILQARILRRTIQKRSFFFFFLSGSLDPDNHNGVITHLEPHILACEVRWALESISTNKASGGDRIPAELFQVLKDDAVKVLHSIWQHIWKTQKWPQNWKTSVFIPIPKKGSAK